MVSALAAMPPPTPTALPLKLSARAVIVNGEGRVLLVRRCARATSHAGRWEFPGGKGEPGETFDESLRREVAEETGLVVELGRVLGAGEQPLTEIRVAFLFIEARPRASGPAAVRVQLSDEHDAFAWVERAKLPEYDIIPPFRAIAAAYARGEG